jgi:gluconokinase
MTALCFDISSGGVSAVLFDSRLRVAASAESQWQFKTDKSGAATLSLDMIVERFKIALQNLKTGEAATAIDAIGIGCFLHNCVLLDADNRPLTPLFTWLDQRGEEGVAYIRSRLGDRFHERTGCRYHPMFPVFKLAALYLRDSALMGRAKRVVSAKAYLIYRLTGVWLEDHGMASSWGLFHLDGNDWDSTLLGLAGLKTGHLVPVASRSHIAGRVTRQAAAEFGLAEGTIVINGSGDGFLASLGSDCEIPSRISVTLGTSGVARQALPRSVLNPTSGTFCYKSDDGQFLLGCAGNNGGNALDWGRSIFGELDVEVADDLPIFVPLLRGERSPEWDLHLAASFHDLRAHHTAPHMARSVLEGVVFNLQWFVEILQETSANKVSEIVLSGNGFLSNSAPRILASIAGMPVLMPADPGNASLRGAAICVFRALGRDFPALDLQRISPLSDDRILQRYHRYKELRQQI